MKLVDRGFSSWILGQILWGIWGMLMATFSEGSQPLLTLLVQLIAPDLCAPVSALQGRQLSSADVRLLHRGRKQPGESKQGKGLGKHSSAVFLW